MLDIYTLLYHLKNCPEYFLQSISDQPGELPQTGILIKDIFRRIYGNFNVSEAELPLLSNVSELDINHCTSLQVACWFFSYPFFNSNPKLLSGIHDFLMIDLKEVCFFVKAREWVEDDDRSEEFIRMALKRCEMLLSGENAAQANDRLEALDTLKRHAVLKGSQKSMERIMEIRRQMAEKKARESANVYGRE